MSKTESLDIDEPLIAERLSPVHIEALKEYRAKQKPPTDREEFIVERAMHDVGVRFPERMDGKRVRVTMEVIE